MDTTTTTATATATRTPTTTTATTTTTTTTNNNNNNNNATITFTNLMKRTLMQQFYPCLYSETKKSISLQISANILNFIILSVILVHNRKTGNVNYHAA